MKNRESNIELLRILSAMAVVILHFNFFPQGGGAVENTSGVANYVLNFGECICACAVNVFIMISGYFSSTNNSVKTGKLFQILLQTMVFQEVFAIIYSFENGIWSVRRLVGALIPANYYVILYIVLMLISPYLNHVINNISKNNKTNIQFLAVVFCLFSIYPTLVDVLAGVLGDPLNGLSSIGYSGSGSGYTIINFILVYIVGTEIRIMDLPNKMSRQKVVILLSATMLALYVWHIAQPGTALMYSNPLLIFEGALFVILFCGINIRSAWINNFAKAAFTCYLVHLSLLRYFDFKILQNKNIMMILLIVVVLVSVIYLISCAAYLIWNFITKNFLYKIESCLPIIKFNY